MNFFKCFFFSFFWFIWDSNTWRRLALIGSRLHISHYYIRHHNNKNPFAISAKAQRYQLMLFNVLWASCVALSLLMSHQYAQQYTLSKLTHTIPSKSGSRIIYIINYNERHIKSNISKDWTNQRWFGHKYWIITFSGIFSFSFRG